MSTNNNSISICIITKDESEKLQRCLLAASNFPFEIVVADTGSSDDSVEIAHRFTEKVFSFPWINDFSAARNFVAAKASHDLILFIDSDEYIRPLSEEEIDGLVELITSNRKNIGRIRIVNEVITNNATSKYIRNISRIYDRTVFHYFGAIHEQLIPGSTFDSNSSVSIDSINHYDVPLSVEHDGYAGTIEHRNKKATRNCSLLLNEYQKNPDDPYICYQLGKSYFMMDEFSNATTYFEKAFEYQVDRNLEYVYDLVESYGYSLLNTEQFSKALLLEALEPDFGNSADFCFVMGLIYMNNGMFERAIASFLQATSAPIHKMEGVHTYLAYYNIGVIYECTGNVVQAIEYYKRCKLYEAARLRLEILTK